MEQVEQDDKSVGNDSYSGSEEEHPAEVRKLQEQLTRLELAAAKDRADSATRLEKILQSIEGLKDGDDPKGQGQRAPATNAGPLGTLKQILREVFGTLELGRFATARDRQSFAGIWEFMETSGDYLLGTVDAEHAEWYEQLTYQAVVTFVATHKHWNNALAVKCDKERWASWSDGRRKEWMQAVKARSSKEFQTPEEKKERYKTKKAKEQETKTAQPSVIVMEGRRNRSRSRGRSERRRSKGRDERRARSRSRSDSREDRRSDKTRGRQTERRRSRSGSERRANRDRTPRRSRERPTTRRHARSHSRSHSRSRAKSTSRRSSKTESREKQATSPVVKRKRKCDMCGGDHYANDVAFHPEHPKAMKYDRKHASSPESPRRR